jgi:hypothetical protein
MAFKHWHDNTFIEQASSIFYLRQITTPSTALGQASLTLGQAIPIRFDLPQATIQFLFFFAFGKFLIRSLLLAMPH